MIDFVKVDIRGCNIEQLRANKRLDFKRKISVSTGEDGNKQIAEFHYMELIVFDSGYIALTGSLHKAFNSIAGIQSPQQPKKMKGFNGNQFNYTQLRYILNYLRDLIGFDLNKSVLRNVEFGVNLTIENSIPMLLSNLMRHRGKPFVNPMEYYFQAEHDQYKVKCYFKSNQYKMSENVLRFELQFKTMKIVNKLGIIYVSDLLKMPLLDNLKRELLCAWYDAILYDYTIRESELIQVFKKWLDRYKNANFWNVELAPNKMDRHKKKLTLITENHSDRLQKRIGTLIENNWNGLNVRCDTFNALFG